MTMYDDRTDSLEAMEHEVAAFKAHRAVIEQAKGVLIQLLAVDEERAFAVLNRYSQTHNIKLRVLAERIVGAAACNLTPPTTGDEQGVLRLLEDLATRQG